MLGMGRAGEQAAAVESGCRHSPRIHGSRNVGFFPVFFSRSAGSCLASAPLALRVESPASMFEGDLHRMGGSVTVIYKRASRSDSSHTVTAVRRGLRLASARFWPLGHPPQPGERRSRPAPDKNTHHESFMGSSSSPLIWLFARTQRFLCAHVVRVTYTAARFGSSVPWQARQLLFRAVRLPETRVWQSRTPCAPAVQRHSLLAWAGRRRISGLRVTRQHTALETESQSVAYTYGNRRFRLAYRNLDDV